MRAAAAGQLWRKGCCTCPLGASGDGVGAAGGRAKSMAVAGSDWRRGLARSGRAPPGKESRSSRTGLRSWKRRTRRSCWPCSTRTRTSSTGSTSGRTRSCTAGQMRRKRPHLLVAAIGGGGASPAPAVLGIVSRGYVAGFCAPALDGCGSLCPTQAGIRISSPRAEQQPACG